MDKIKENKESKEIDFIGLFLRVLRDWKTLLIFILVFAVIGVIVAINTPKKFTTTVLLAPESSSSGLGGELDTFGQMLGLNMSSNSSDAIVPELYPNIFTSTNFLLGLYDVKVTMNDYQTEKTYYKHLKADYAPPFWSYPKIWLSKLIKSFSKKKGVPSDTINPFHLSEEQYNICNLMRRNIQCNVDQRTGLVTLTVTDIDEVVAAILADTLTNRLQDYITEYRTKKARNDLEFVEILCEQAKNDYLKAQSEYANFADATMNIYKTKLKAQQDNLESEMLLKQTLYSNVSQQLLVARQRVQERTPAFTIIQEASVAIEASSMSRMLMVIIWSFLGFVAGAFWCLYLREAYHRWKGR